MGGVCPGCLRGTAQEEKAYYQRSQYPPWPQQPLPQPEHQRPRLQPQPQQQPQQVLRPQQRQQPQQVLLPQQVQQPLPQQQQRTTEEDWARSDEARANAATAAQKRAEAFEKSAGGRAARTAIAAAKANPLSSRNDAGLRWTMG